jgi:hypothetical protein
MEETIERIIGFFRHAAQGLERKQTTSGIGGRVSCRPMPAVGLPANRVKSKWSRQRKNRPWLSTMPADSTRI